MLDARSAYDLGSLAAEIGVEFAVGAGLAIMAVVARKAVRTRIRLVTYGTIGTHRYASQFCDVFAKLIAEDQQISPNVILRHARSERRFPRTRRGVKWALKRRVNRPVVYQLLLAVQGGRVVGFLNSLINLRDNYCFIAYLGTTRGKSAPGQIATKLLNRLFRQVRLLPSTPLTVFEVSPPAATSASSRAKIRLFSEYARLRGIEILKAPIAYVQPDMEPRRLDGITEAPADLCIVSTRPVLESFTTTGLLALVNSLYNDIYLKTFLDLGEHARYVSYIANLFEAVRDRELRAVTGLGRMDTP